MISINATLIIQIINFLILVWILNRILFRPIFKIIEERESVIQNSKAEAGRLRSESEKKIKHYENQLNDVRTAIAVQKKAARIEAKRQAREIMQAAKTQAQEHILAIQEEAAREAERVKSDLVDFKESIVKLVFSSVMGREA